MKKSLVFNLLLGLFLAIFTMAAFAQNLSSAKHIIGSYGGGAVIDRDQAVIELDDGTNFDAIGLTNGGTFSVAAQFTSAQTAQYTGWNLIQVQVYINNVPSSSTLKIWDAGTANAPGPLLYSAPFTATEANWNTITLTTPVVIEGGDIWIGYEVTHGAGQFPCGCDAGPAVPGGDWLYDGSSWSKLHVIAPNLNYNWNIAGVVEEVVPVELSSFAAYDTHGNVNLVWSTATETNSRGFEIQKSTGGNYFTIGFVKGQGTTTESHSYSFVEKNAGNGNASYRLKQLDFNGAFAYSNIVTLNVDAPANYQLAQNYPNPFNPTTQINFALPVDAGVKITVYNALGQQMTELVNQNFTAGNHILNFNATSLSSGLYFYVLQANGVDGSSYTASKKMMLMK